MNRTAPTTFRRRLILAGSLTAAAALAFTGCASGSGSGADDASGSEAIGVSLIVKTTTNPFFVAMQEGAEAAADDLGVELTFAAGKEDGDEDTQIQAVENAISKGDAGILITPNGPAVEDALIKARDAGLFVIALDTPPSDPESVDITFATDNFQAGQSRSASGRPRSSAARRPPSRWSISSTTRSSRSTSTATRASSTAWASTSPTRRPTATKRPPATTAAASTRSSATRHRRAPRTAGAPRQRTCCRRTPTSTSSTRSTSRPPTARTRPSRPRARPTTLIVVSVDGGCAGIDAVKEGIIGATSQQYPVKMAELGVQAIYDLVQTGEVAREHRRARLLRHRRRARHRRPAGRRRVDRHQQRPARSAGADPRHRIVRAVRIGRSDASLASAHSRSAPAHHRHRSTNVTQHTTEPPTAALDLAEEFLDRTTPLSRIRNVLHRYPAVSPAIVLVLAVIVFGLLNDRFLNPANLSLITQQVAVVGHARDRPDAHHPHRGHRPLGRRGHGAGVDGDGPDQRPTRSCRP